jgi:ribosomal protein L19E
MIAFGRASMAKQPKRSTGTGQRYGATSVRAERQLDQWMAAVVTEIRAVDRRVEETKSQAQMQFEALQCTIQMLATHIVRLESRLEQHLQRSAFERAQIRQEVMGGNAAVDRCLQRLEERA